MTGIIGSGFGLYGYMPAVLLEDEQVFLLEKTREKFFKRNELLRFEHRILWAKDLETLLASIDTLIISLPPQEQYKLLDTVLSFSNIKHLILEKPVAASPLESLYILQSILEKRKNVRVNYTFLGANWFKILENVIASNKNSQLSLSIKWHFKAHHFRNNIDTWKKKHNEGGAAIRFYGIHFIALAADLGFDKVAHSNTNDTTVSNWLCNVLDKQENNLNIDIDTNNEKETFSISVKANGEQIHSYKTKDPFDEVQTDDSGLDKRIKGLGNLYTNLKSSNISIELFNYYQAANNLWKSIEDVLLIKSR